MSAARGIPKIARLTLFSGPNCSLCDIAKAELKKVQQSRPSLDLALTTINIQDPDQAQWKKKYVYWIPALHLEGKEIAKGRWDAGTVLQALDKWEREKQEKTD